MARAFKVTPKRAKRSNGTILTPEMEVIVTTPYSSPFSNGMAQFE